MTTLLENDLLTRVEGDAPMGRMMRAHSWIPFAQSDHLRHGDAPFPVRLFGEQYAASRYEDGGIGFVDELGSQRYPVTESGGLAWVWLGEGPSPSLPEFPFADPQLYRFWCTCRVPCNWLQGLEGSVDSVHAGVLHQTWIAEAAKLAGHSNLGFTLDRPPTYETEATSYGLRAAALRHTTDGRTYVRVTEHLLPLVTVVPVGGNMPRSGTAFAICPVDDTHHVLFFGNFGETPDRAETLDRCAMQDPRFVPDPLDYTGLRGDRSDAWGQDRALMANGHYTGFGRSLLEEDAVIQTSMGPIVDRTKEHLSSSDVAVAHLRRMLLEALTDFEAGRPPVGSARGAQPVVLPNASEALISEGGRWQEDSRPAART